MRFLTGLVSCACSLVLGLASTVSLLGALSCTAHGIVMASAPPETHSAAANSASPFSSASALAGVAMFCVFLGGVHVALRLCSLGFAILLLGTHLWIRTVDPASLAHAADSLLLSVMLPLRARLDLGEEWDCVFFGPPDALYMMAATRHAASVLAALRKSLVGLRSLATLAG